MKKYLFLTVATISCMIYACSKDAVTTGAVTTLPTPTPPAPTLAISDFNPKAAMVGNTVMITGMAFSTDSNAVSVKFGTSNGVKPKSITATTMGVVVPKDAHTGKITVTINGNSVTSTDNFTLTAPPPPVLTVTGFTPLTAKAGETVTITGTTFGTDSNLVSIKFGTATGIKPKTISATTMTVVVPATAQTGKITVTVNGSSITSADNFTLIATPPTGGSTDSNPAPGKAITVAGGNYDLRAPEEVFLDASNNMYVADFANYRIQKYPAGGSSPVTVAGGNGSGRADNQLSGGRDVFVDASGNVFVPNDDRVMKWAAGATSGVVVAGPNLTWPKRIFVDAAGSLYIAEGDTKVEKWAKGATSGVVIAGTDGTAGSAANQLFRPWGIFVDANENIYIADQGNHRIQKWAKGATSGITVAGGNGAGFAANQFYDPSDVFVDAAENIYIADSSNQRIQKWAKGASSGVTVAGGNGFGSAANQFKNPRGVFVDKAGYIYVADQDNNRIQKWGQ